MEINLELGKWLLDISKYLVTAMLLATAFSDMSNPWIVIVVIISAALTLLGGLWLIDKSKKKNQNIKRNKKGK